MKCVVPLAGPDVIHPVAGLTPLRPVDGAPMIERVLKSRAWADRLTGADYVFVVPDRPEVAPLTTFLAETWPGCAIVRLPHLTGGALLTALAGAAVAPAASGPLIVDLADILFEGGDLPSPWPQDLGGLVPCFRSTEARFSYLRLDGGRVLETAEKRVISEAASAGVYVFRDLAVLAAAAAHSITNRATLAHRGVLFVCPAMNGVIAQGLAVEAAWVDTVQVLEKA
jgi:hypothetical protein